MNGAIQAQGFVVMIKSQRLDIECSARSAYSMKISCELSSKRLAVGVNGPLHEFDIYAEGLVIGGISTGTYNTSLGKTNTGARDRACAELLWLSLWPGSESCTHILTDMPLATWLVKRFGSAPFLKSIDIYHYDVAQDSLNLVGRIGEKAFPTDEIIV